SGLHMGLVCFGVMGVVRFCGALFLAYAVQVPLHKVAAVAALIVDGLMCCCRVARSARYGPFSWWYCW
ncbi:MAG: hypothetical protein VW472_08195, partial [Candidatus Puniceispirillum sp.]